jgi:hypothetical protein
MRARSQLALLQGGNRSRPSLHERQPWRRHQDVSPIKRSSGQLPPADYAPAVEEELNPADDSMHDAYGIWEAGGYDAVDGAANRDLGLPLRLHELDAHSDPHAARARRAVQEAVQPKRSSLPAVC